MPDEIVESWVDGLPRDKKVHLVSLLGRKQDGRSEYSFYTFRGGHEHPDGKPTFQEWLDGRYGGSRFVVHDYPTEDAGDSSLSDELITTLEELILGLLSEGETAVLFDSGGAQRTGQFCRAIGFRRLPLTGVRR